MTNTWRIAAQTGAVLLHFMISGAPVAGQILRGTVVDAASGAPIEGVVVMLVPAAADTALSSVLTESTGGFFIRAPAAGDYRLKATHIGFGVLTTESYGVSQDAVVTVRIALAATPVALAPLEVVEERLEPPYMRDIRQRMELGFGKFVTREDLEMLGNVPLQSVLERVQGVWVVERRRSINEPLTLHIELYRGQVGAGGCETSIYLNGLRMAGSGSIGADDIGVLLRTMSSEDIEAIEVYRGVAELPDRYGGSGSNCGVVAIWQRTGGERVEKAEGFEGPPLLDLSFAIGGTAAERRSGAVGDPGMGGEAEIRWRAASQLIIGLGLGKRYYPDGVDALHAGLNAYWLFGLGSLKPFASTRFAYARRKEQPKEMTFRSSGLMVGASGGVLLNIGQRTEFQFDLFAERTAWNRLKVSATEFPGTEATWFATGVRMMIVRRLH